MNKEKSKSLIEAAFGAPKAKLHRGAILVPAEPLDMLAVAKSAIEMEEKRTILTTTDWTVFMKASAGPMRTSSPSTGNPWARAFFKAA